MHGDYSSIAIFRTEIPQYFEGYLEFLKVLKILYGFFYSIFHGTLVGKH